MRKISALFLIVLIISFTACKNKDKQKQPENAAQGQLIDPAQLDQEKVKARNVCETWAKVLDSRDFTTAYQQTSQYFKTTVPAADWAKFHNSLDSFGINNKREFLAAEFFQGKAENKIFEYIVCKFNSSFTKKKVAVETISVIREANEWKIMGYFID
jgi:hypothetical protein